jgi:hypothetical protein
MTITISENVAAATIESLLKYMQRKKVPFALDTDDDDARRTAAIRERLHLKYVLNGEWATMDDEDRQDASLLEGMLYDDENGNVEVLTKAEQIEFRHEMKSWAKK